MIIFTRNLGGYGTTVTGEDGFSSNLGGQGWADSAIADATPISATGSNSPARQSLANSWLQTVQSLIGSGTKAHKPSFVLFDIGQSGCMTLAKWLEAHRAITFQEDILQETVRFPRLSVYQRIRQSSTDVYGFSLTVEQLTQVQRLANPNQFLQDLHRGGCRIVYLNRRDALRHAIATLRNHSVTCRFDSQGTHTRSNKLRVDVSELLACLKYLDYQRIEASAILHDLPFLELVYEEDLMDPNLYGQTAHKLSTFLEIEDIQPVGSSLKLALSMAVLRR